ncbi:hypothetical protein [Streptacidiphilus rugosus]|uniref:hypothetical protein n=1 Tax=Streptacidiphilus rugosus TaxID=405783 RepID=UPI000568156C|nr:hypothetical protein [Streptacidiphilus rugosus]
MTIRRWAALLALGLAAVVVAVYAIPGHSEKAPLWAVSDQPDPVDHWRYNLATTAGDMLLRTDTGYRLLYPDGETSLLTELGAGAALGGATTARITPSDLRDAYSQSTGLFGYKTIDPLYVTWLTVRYEQGIHDLSLLEPRKQAILRSTRLAVAKLVPTVQQGDLNAATSLVHGVQVLTLLGDTAPLAGTGLEPCSRLAAAAGAGQLEAADTWLQLAALARVSCDVPFPRALTDAAHTAVTTQYSSLNLPEVADAAAGLDILRTAGKRSTAAPAVCQELFEEAPDDGLLPSHQPVFYLVCRDALDHAGLPVTLSSRVRTSLELQVQLHGQLVSNERTDSLGVLYASSILRGLNFRPAVVSGTAGEQFIPEAADFDSTVLKFAHGTPDFSGPELDRLAATLGGDKDLRTASMTAAVILSSHRCSARAVDGLRAAYGATPSQNLALVLRKAMVVTALGRCWPAGGDWVQEQKAKLLDFLGSQKKQGGLFGDDPDVLQTWWGQESQCLLAGRSDIDERALLPLLPPADPGASQFTFRGDQIYGALRLTQLLHGCGGAWWATRS